MLLLELLISTAMPTTQRATATEGSEREAARQGRRYGILDLLFGDCTACLDTLKISCEILHGCSYYLCLVRLNTFLRVYSLYHRY